MRHSVEYPLSKFKLLRSMKYLFLQDLNLWKLSIQRKHSHNFLNRRQLFQVTFSKHHQSHINLHSLPCILPYFFWKCKEMSKFVYEICGSTAKHVLTETKKRTSLVRHWNKYNNSNNKYNWLSITDGTSTLEKKCVFTRHHKMPLSSLIKRYKNS